MLKNFVDEPSTSRFSPMNNNGVKRSNKSRCYENPGYHDPLYHQRQFCTADPENSIYSSVPNNQQHHPMTIPRVKLYSNRSSSLDRNLWNQRQNEQQSRMQSSPSLSYLATLAPPPSARKYVHTRSTFWDKDFCHHNVNHVTGFSGPVKQPEPLYKKHATDCHGGDQWWARDRSMMRSLSDGSLKQYSIRQGGYNPYAKYNIKKVLRL